MQRSMAAACAAICLAVTVSGCAAPSAWRPEGFGNTARNLVAPKKPVFYFDRVSPDPYEAVKLYVDSRGDLYPEDRPGVAGGLPRAFVPSGYRPNRWSLRTLMKDRSTRSPQPAVGTLLCDRVAHGSTAERMCEAAPDYSRWKALQAELWRDKARSVVAGADDDTVFVVLLHGFNVARGDADYAYAKASLSAASRRPETLRFIEVHWDGGDTTSAWNRAQYSGQFVGLGVRQLLSEIRAADPKGAARPIRIVTHSSGAFVAGALLGDSRLPNSTFWRTFSGSCAGRPASLEAAIKDRMRDCADNVWARRQLAQQAEPGGPPLIPPPAYDDIRILMLAAATPAQTFTGGGSPKAAGLMAPNVQLFVSVNRSDEAINKSGFGPTTPFTSDTTLGALKDDYCSLQQNLDQRRSQNPADTRHAYGFEFTREDPIPRGWWRKPTGEGKAAWMKFRASEDERQAHSWPLYLEQAAYDRYDVLNLFMNYSGADDPAFLARLKTNTTRLPCDGDAK